MSRFSVDRALSMVAGSLDFELEPVDSSRDKLQIEIYYKFLLRIRSEFCKLNGTTSSNVQR